MKYYISFILLIMLSKVSDAQNLVFSFDNAEWETYSCGNGQPDYQEPKPTTFFTTLNKLCTIGLQPIITVSQTNDAYMGQAALMRTQILGTANQDSTPSLFSTLIPGLINSGTFNTANIANPLEQGQPYTGRPACFTGWYKYLPINQDSGAISVKLTKNGQLIGNAEQVIKSAVTTWTQFNLNFTYVSTDNPDTINISFVSSAGGQDGDGYKGSKLYIDEVFIGTCTNAVGEGSAVFVNLFPNPASEEIFIDWKENIGQVQFELYSLQGKKVKEMTLFSATQISVKELPKGLYFYQINDRENKIQRGKLLIE